MSLEDVLEGLTKDLLEELLEGNNLKYKKSLTKAKLAAFVTEKAEKKGTDLLYASLEKETLRAALTDLDKTPEHDSKTKMLKEFKEGWKKKGLEDYLEGLTVDTLKLIAADLCFEVESDKVEDFVEQIGDEIDILGMKKYFGVMAKVFMEDCANALKVKSIGSKKVLIDRVLSVAFTHLSDEEKKKEKKGKKSKSKREPDYDIIKDGVDYDTLFQEFFHHELVQYCKDNGLLANGRRRDVINRILAFLGGDEITTKPGKKKKKRKAMSEPTKKRKRKEKANAKKLEDEKEAKKIKKKKRCTKA